MLDHRLRCWLNIKPILYDVPCLLEDSVVFFSRQSAACYVLEIGKVNLEDDSTNPDGRQYPWAVITGNETLTTDDEILTTVNGTITTGSETLTTGNEALTTGN